MFQPLVGKIKNNENRVGMTPSGVFELTKRNHEVYVQKSAGFGSGFFDKDYVNAGATILDTIEEVYKAADMIVKVKEPIEEEYALIKPHHVVFTYFHFASSEPLTHAMIASNAVCIAYETVEDENGTLPLLIASRKATFTPLPPKSRTVVKPASNVLFAISAAS